MDSPTKRDVKTPARSYRDLVELPINTTRPLIMHIDLNSCFSTIEQQANPLIRNKPVAVGAYAKDSGIILAASYDAKALGIKLGTSVREARQICPDIIILMPDPPKYREAHRRFREVLQAYTDDVAPKSIDEFVLDFHGADIIRRGRPLEDIGREIKQRIKEQLGCYVTVNIGIGSNRFLAKLAAGLHKPNGLDVITPDNILEIYRSIDLLALPGINRRFKARLLAAGIATPYEMYQASGKYLRHFVFFSKLGYQWHQRLRGWEVDDAVWGHKSIGHQYALEHHTFDKDEIKRLLMKLCEKTGRRLRRHGYVAYGIDLHIRYVYNRELAETGGHYGPNGWGHSGYSRHWHQSRKTAQPLYATQEIYRAAASMLDRVRLLDKVSLISVSVFNLRTVSESGADQLDLFEDQPLDYNLGRVGGTGATGFGSRRRRQALARAADEANNRYGEFTVIPAIMAGMDKTILDRIAFGNVSDI